MASSRIIASVIAAIVVAGAVAAFAVTWRSPVAAVEPPAPDSFDKSRNIWCSPDRAKAWDEWMINGKPAASAKADCQAPNEQVLALGQKLRIQGTPAIFFADGSRIPGAIDLPALEKKLETVKQ